MWAPILTWNEQIRTYYTICLFVFDGRQNKSRKAALIQEIVADREIVGQVMESD